MAAFSYQYQQQPFIVDSIMVSQLHEEHNINTSFTPSYFHIHQEPSFSVIDTQETSCDQSSKISISDTELSIVKNQSPQNSMVVDKLENGEQVTQKVTSPMEKKRRTRKSSSLSSPLSKDSKEGGSKKQKKNSDEVKGEEKKEQKKNDEELPKGYIHVRARRGQATDSHSLAERVRREKISERMKILQKLVPGCDQVTGKALVLDEIINYVQSLQNQVEFLSMKLASMNPIFFDMAMDIDTLFVRPDQKLNNMASTSELPSMVPLCSSNNATTTTFADTTTVMTTSTNNYDYLLDYPSPVFLQGHKSNTFLEHTGGGPFWDTEDHRQKFLNPYGFGNNTCSLN